MRTRLLALVATVSVMFGFSTIYAADAGAAERRVITLKNDGWCC